MLPTTTSSTKQCWTTFKRAQDARINSVLNYAKTSKRAFQGMSWEGKAFQVSEKRPGQRNVQWVGWIVYRTCPGIYLQKHPRGATQGTVCPFGLDRCAHPVPGSLFL
eukprot:sb/3477731/